jgi:hypothetical protein
LRIVLVRKLGAFSASCSKWEKENDPLTYEIISAAIVLSKYWGNGVLENVYKKSLAINR